jgi:hypothetical protein
MLSPSVWAASRGYGAHVSGLGRAGSICSDGAVVCARLAAVVKRWPRTAVDHLSFGPSRSADGGDVHAPTDHALSDSRSWTRFAGTPRMSAIMGVQAPSLLIGWCGSALDLEPFTTY